MRSAFCAAALPSHYDGANPYRNDAKLKTVAIALLGLFLTGCATQKFPPVLVSGKTVVFQGLIYASTADEFVRAVEQHLVGWHGNMEHLLYLHRTGKAPLTGTLLEEVTTLAAHEAEFYKTIGVDPFVTWFGKLAPYNVCDTYFLAPHDMERFSLHNVSARADYAQTDLAPYNASGVEKVRFVEVRW